MLRLFIELSNSLGSQIRHYHSPKVSVHENKKYGRVRGEGSLCAAIKSQSASKFGIRVQPEPNSS